MAAKPKKAKAKEKVKSKKGMSQEELSKLLKKSIEENESKHKEEGLGEGFEELDADALEFNPLVNIGRTRAPVLETIAGGDGSVATPIFVARARAAEANEDPGIKYESVGKDDSKYSAGHEYESPNVREAASVKDFSANREVSMDTSLSESRRSRWAAEEAFSAERVRNQGALPWETQNQEKKYKEPKHKKL